MRAASLSMRRIGGFAALLAAWLFWPAPVTAQDCGSWNRPMLCEAELVVYDNIGGATRLTGNSRLQIAPREELALSLHGRDQRGRNFPPEWMAIGFDDRRCGSMLAISDEGEGTLNLRANATSGSCQLDVWVPGNLNFFWQIEVEISAAARTGYSRAEAELTVRALYQAILQRAPDADGFRGGVGEVQRGNLDDLVSGMLRSAEFSQSAVGQDASQLLERFYQGVFERSTDTGGVREYLTPMQQGRFAEVLVKMIRSSEFETRLERLQ